MFSRLKKMICRFEEHHYPRLNQIDALLDRMVLGFGWFNILLGPALYLQKATTTHFFIINSFFTYQFWGVVFTLGGFTLLLGHFLNRWDWIRQALQFLIFTKIIWLTALIGRQIGNFDSNVFLILFFGLALYFQAALFLRFPIYNKVETWSH